LSDEDGYFHESIQRNKLVPNSTKALEIFWFRCQSY